MIKLAIIDDHVMVRRGLSSLISNNSMLTVDLECDNGKQFLEAIPKMKIDIALLDIDMPEMNGIETLERLHQQGDSIKVIILSSDKSQIQIASLMELGARGYLLKNADILELEEAIFSVHQTGFYFNDLVSKAILVRLANKDKINPTFNGGEHFTKREKEVLQLICQEFTTQEIADRLFLSPRTIENHRIRMMDKTGARNTAGLVVFAIKNHFFDVG